MFSDIEPLDWENVEQPGEPEYHDVMTIELQQLLSDPYMYEVIQARWQTFDAYDEEQRTRLWQKFRARFDWREIGVLPIRKWLDRLIARLNEIMPKYKALYTAIADGITPMTASDEWHKGRDVYSSFPQTALGGSNQDYASSGNDREHETVRSYGLLDVAERMKAYNDVDVMVLDELEPLFVCLISTTIPNM
jgi:hypothetical protein